MTLKGKGFYIWQIPACEGGDADLVANTAEQAGLSHVLIKIADGKRAYNIQNNIDLVPQVARALKNVDIQVWGWHYVYGNEPLLEADIAITRLNQLGLDGYVINAEREYEDLNKYQNAQKFMSRLRTAYPNLPMALSSFKYPIFHPSVPWKAFLEGCDYNMPQVYWLLNHNPGDQLKRSVNEFQQLTPFRPIIPTGSAYKESSWSPTVKDIIEFMDTAKSLNLDGVNYWDWQHCRKDLPQIWETIKAYPWVETQPDDISILYIKALNSHNPDNVINLYDVNGVHVTAARTIQGLSSLSAWYRQLINQILPDGVFILTGWSGSGSSRHFNWTANSTNGNVTDGSDTLGLIDGKIAYHYTSFTITK